MSLKCGHFVFRGMTDSRGHMIISGSISCGLDTTVRKFSWIQTFSAHRRDPSSPSPGSQFLGSHRDLDFIRGVISGWYYLSLEQCTPYSSKRRKRRDRRRSHSAPRVSFRNYDVIVTLPEMSRNCTRHKFELGSKVAHMNRKWRIVRRTCRRDDQLRHLMTFISRKYWWQ